jgi:catalase
VLVIAVFAPSRSAASVCATVHSAPPPPGDRCRLAWRARSGAGPAATGLRHSTCLSETHGVVRHSAGLWDNQPDFAEPPLALEGDAAHWDHRVDDDHWEQPGNLFRKMTPAQQQLLFENTARAMGDARLHIKQRHVANCMRADPAYGAGVAKALGLKQRELVD